MKHIWCVEVNPFFDTTDAALFSWKYDAAVLMGRSDGVHSEEAGGEAAVGVPEPEFRYRTAPAKGASSLVYGCWREIMSEKDEQKETSAPGKEAEKEVLASKLT